MRSRSSDTEGSALKQFPRHSKDHDFQGPEDMKQRQQDKDPTNESDAILSCPKSHGGVGHHGEDLSRDDLLFLLSILEGELQVSWVRIIPMFKEKAACEFGVYAAMEIDCLWFYLYVHERKYTNTEFSYANRKGN